MHFNFRRSPTEQPHTRETPASAPSRWPSPGGGRSGSVSGGGGGGAGAARGAGGGAGGAGAAAAEGSCPRQNGN